MKAVASHVLAQHPTTTPLVWDDMLRAIPEDQLSGQQPREQAAPSGASWGHEGRKPCVPDPATGRRCRHEASASGSLPTPVFSQENAFPLKDVLGTRP